MHCSGHGPPAAFGLVAREQFIEQHKNTAALLGLDLSRGEGRWAGRQDVVFSLSRRGGSPCAVIYEWSWMEKLQGLCGVAPQIPVQSEAPLPSITQHLCLLWSETEGGWEREGEIERKKERKKTSYFQIFLERVIGLFGYQVTNLFSARGDRPPWSRSQVEPPKSHWSPHFVKASFHTCLTHTLASSPVFL